MIWARGVARCGADAPVLLVDQFFQGEALCPRVAPELLAYPQMHELRESLGEPIRQRFEHDRAVIVVLVLVGLDAWFDRDACGYGEATEIVPDTGLLGRNEVAQ